MCLSLFTMPCCSLVHLTCFDQGQVGVHHLMAQLFQCCIGYPAQLAARLGCITEQDVDLSWPVICFINSHKRPLAWFVGSKTHLMRAFPPASQFRYQQRGMQSLQSAAQLWCVLLRARSHQGHPAGARGTCHRHSRVRGPSHALRQCFPNTAHPAGQHGCGMQRSRAWCGTPS